jgi:hypothetical protein
MYGTTDFGGRGMSRAGVRNCTERDGFCAQIPPVCAVVDHAADVTAKVVNVLVPAELTVERAGAIRKARDGEGDMFI